MSAFRGLLGFMSLTTATQACLAVNQLVLLPAQLRVWGAETTRDWLVAVAVASLIGLGDLGLRNAGHSDLLSSVNGEDPAATARFRRVWALTRSAVAASALFLLMLLLVSALASGGEMAGQRALWGAIMTLSLSFDLLLIVRGMWLDTLGYFNAVEMSFLALVVGRTGAAIVAIALFRATPLALGLINLATAVCGLTAQAWLFREPRSLSLLAGGFAELRWAALGVMRFSIAEPATNWVRLSLPVIVLTALASPRFVALYVALRALFGLARQVSNQLARYASIGFVQRVGHDRGGAEAVAIQSLLLSTLMGVAVSSVAIVDHGRLLADWLGVRDPSGEMLATLPLATGAIVYGYQVLAGVLTRSGDLGGVARRQYAFLAANALGAVVGWATGSLVFYLAVLGTAELLVALLFMPSVGRRTGAAFAASVAVGAFLVLALWALTVAGPALVFQANQPAAVVLSLLAAAAATASSAILAWRIAVASGLGQSAPRRA